MGFLARLSRVVPLLIVMAVAAGWHPPLLKLLPLPRPAAAGGGGEALFAIVGVMREEAPVGEARDEEADKAHNHAETGIGASQIKNSP